MITRTVFDSRIVRSGQTILIEVFVRLWIHPFWEWWDCGILLCARSPVSVDVVSPGVWFIGLGETEPSPTHVTDTGLSVFLSAYQTRGYIRLRTVAS